MFTYARSVLAAEEFRFRPVTRDDFPMLAGWLAQPYVHRWWFHEFTAEAIERDFGPGVDGQEPGEDLIAVAAGDPIGLVQRCTLEDYPEYLGPLRAIVDVPDRTGSLDYLVGVESLIGQGAGSAMIRAAVADTWRAFPGMPALIVPVQAGNVASWRALEKAGFVRVGEGDLEPDNPADDPHHVVYRVDRPAGAAGG